jgi:hypothetical protein
MVGHHPQDTGIVRLSDDLRIEEGKTPPSEATRNRLVATGHVPVYGPLIAGRQQDDDLLISEKVPVQRDESIHVGVSIGNPKVRIRSYQATRTRWEYEFKYSKLATVSEGNGPTASLQRIAVEAATE